ncbi:hypothetical protein D3C80_527570 [compost metagenome]
MFESNSPERATLADEGRSTDGPHRPKRFDRIGRTAGNMEFLFRANDQVEHIERRLQLGRHLGTFDEPAFPITVTRNTPQIGAVIDIERGAQSVLARQRQRLDHGRFRTAVA